MASHRSDQGRVSLWGWSTAGIVFCSLLLGIASAAQSDRHAQGTPPAATHPDIIFVESPTVASGPLPQRFPQGSRIVRLHSPATPEPLVNLTPEFFAAADPEVSFDGANVLFSGKKEHDEPWQVWEMNVDGSKPHQITSCAADCLRAAYLPAGEIAFTVFSNKKGRLASYLAVSSMDGSQLRRITFGPGDFQLETVLRDGRILASAPWPLLASEDAADSRLFYTLRPDGAALESLRCEHRQTTVQTDGEELENGSIVFVRSSHAGQAKGGALAQIRRGAPGESALGSGQLLYRWPRQMSAHELIVARQRPSPADSPAKFDLYAYHLGSGTLGERIYSDAQRSSIQAVPLVAHAAPKRFWSMVNPQSGAGYFISLNSYVSAGNPEGRITTPITHVRVMTSDPTSGRERALGEAPVEQDGSFYVEVPANQPIRFEMLDAEGRTIRAERSWIWARSGEQRGCAGCHGDKALAPENHWPLTLKRFDTPTNLGDKEHGSAASPAK